MSRGNVPLGQLFVPNNSIPSLASFCKFRRMTRAIIFALLLVFPVSLHAKVIKWEGKPFLVSISTERLTRIEFPEAPPVRLSLAGPDIAVEKKTGRFLSGRWRRR